MRLIEIVKAADGVVGCTGSDCTVCGVLSTVSQTINFLMGVSAAAAALVLVLAGLAYIFTTGRKRLLEKAKVFARNGIIGFLLILVSWLVIRTLFFVSGYQDAAGWWRFSCETEVTAIDYQTDSLKSLKAYPDVAAFLASGEEKARISEPTPLNIFMTQVGNLKTGEELIFYLPAKNNKDNSDVQIPFLAGYKSSNGQLSIDPQTTQLLEKLVESVSSGKISLLGKDSSILSAKSSADLTSRLISMLWNSVIGNLSESSGLSSSVIDQLKSAASLDDKIAAVQRALPSFQRNDGSANVGRMINDIVEQSLEIGRLVVERGDSGDRSSVTDSGDRSTGSTLPTSEDKAEKTKDSGSAEGTEDKWSSSTSSTPKPTNNVTNIPPGPQPPVSPDKWEPSRDPKKPDPGQLGDDFGDMDKDRDKKKPDELSQDDWNPGDGSPEAIKKALRRINKRDYLRYEMMFRYVQHIGDAPGGGQCNGCGDIYVDHRARILDIAHIAVHEGTHAGHACTVGWGGFSEGEIEAIACANQQGSLYRGKTPDMKEFPRARESINYKGKEVRGHLARYWTGVNPKGDLNDQILGGLFKAMTDYPISKGWSNQGEYPYGWGEGYHLRINQRLEDVVKTVMTKEGPINCEWGSCPTSDLPKLSVKCDCKPIQID